MNYPTQTLATTTPVRASGAPRVAVVGAGIGGLSCARELALRGFEPVVFEASDRVGGRCSSLLTRVGWFDDGAQVINGNTLLSTYAAQEPDRLAASHVWTMPSAPVDAPSWRKAKPQDEDDPGDERELEWLGTVGVPSMRGLAEAIAKPLSVRLNTPIRQAYRHHSQWVLQGDSGDVDGTFQALVLAIPAPQALPLASGSRAVSKALSGVRYRNRWVLLLGSERAIHLPSYRVYGSGPIERIAAMHSKPGRLSASPQRWFIEASERWSMEHSDDDAETVADLLLDQAEVVDLSRDRRYGIRFKTNGYSMPGFYSGHFRLQGGYLVDQRHTVLVAGAAGFKRRDSDDTLFQVLEAPDRDELIDWLACELVDHNWSLKHLHRLIVTSAAYRMDSTLAGASAELARDPDNRHWWRRIGVVLCGMCIMYLRGPERCYRIWLN